MIFLYSDEKHFAGLSSLLRNSFQLYPISSPPKFAKSQTWLPYLEEQAEVEKIRSKIKCLVRSRQMLDNLICRGLRLELHDKVSMGVAIFKSGGKNIVHQSYMHLRFKIQPVDPNLG